MAKAFLRLIRNNYADRSGKVIDYLSAVTGKLNIVPESDTRAALAEDYEHMHADEIMLGEALSFEHLMQACREVQNRANQAAMQ